MYPLLSCHLVIGITWELVSNAESQVPPQTKEPVLGDISPWVSLTSCLLAEALITFVFKIFAKQSWKTRWYLPPEQKGKYAARLIKIVSPSGIKEGQVCFQVFHRLRFPTFQVLQEWCKPAAGVASHGSLCIDTWDFRNKGNQSYIIKG